MIMPQRSTSSGSYRYGFNGKENDNEVKGSGNQQDYGMRIYDPRLGRFLSVDPLEDEYPWYTPYQFAGNTPIQALDLDGLEPQDFRSNGTTGEKFTGGIQQYDYANYKGEISGGNDVPANGIKAGVYTIVPTVKPGSNDVIYYTAWRTKTNDYVDENGKRQYKENQPLADWVISPEKLKSFTENADRFLLASSMYRNFDRDFALRSSTLKMIDKDMAGYLVDEWKSALSNPMFYYSLVGSYWAFSRTSAAKSTYARPRDATIPIQRRAIQNMPCVDCGSQQARMYADHKLPLVVEKLTTGTINRTRMQSIDAVQPQCASCSGAQGYELRKWAAKQRTKTYLPPPTSNQKADD